MFITENVILSYLIPILIWCFDTLMIETRLKEHVKNEMIRGMFASLISTVTLPLAFLIIRILKQPIKYFIHNPFLIIVIVFGITALCELIKYLYKKEKEKSWKMY